MWRHDSFLFHSWRFLSFSNASFYCTDLIRSDGLYSKKSLTLYFLFVCFDCTCFHRLTAQFTDCALLRLQNHRIKPAIMTVNRQSQTIYRRYTHKNPLTVCVCVCDQPISKSTTNQISIETRIKLQLNVLFKIHWFIEFDWILRVFFVVIFSENVWII